MKFSDIQSSEWDNIKTYLDTAVLPITGISGLEAPWEATIALEQLRDVLDLLEIPYKGRIVTYPAVHYTFGDELELQVNRICRNLKEAGFTYVIAITSQETLSTWDLADADLFLHINWDEVHINPEMVKQNISQGVQRIWRRE
jgi:23S rRNA (pseudouridine1915-N3)-methyltransferase